MRIDCRDPLVAISDYLSAAETALRQLMRSPNDQTAHNTYNFAVGRIIATIRDAKLDPWTQPLRVPSFEDPLAVETVRVDGQILLLAADFTAPLP